MKRCYSHNVFYPACPTPLVCFFKHCISIFAWALIHSIAKKAVR